MSTAPAYRLVGLPASPYSIKIRALMRYRRLPFVWQLQTDAVRHETAHVKPPLIPMLCCLDSGDWHVDSTPIAHLLEQRHPGARSVLPPDPGLAFIDALLEDMADEWAPKVIMRHRWHPEEDADWSGQWMVGPAAEPVDAATLKHRADAIQQKQTVSLQDYTGVFPDTVAAIDHFFETALAGFESLFDNRQFLAGSRPSLADFAWYGLFMQCFVQRVSNAQMRTEAPRLTYWLFILDDASGIEGAWAAAEDTVPAAVQRLLSLAGSTYLPYLAASLRAQEAGAEWVELDMPGGPYRQRLSPYHVKCLRKLCAAYGSLPDASRQRITGVLQNTGCAPYLSL